jgi:hypothetical protein
VDAGGALDGWQRAASSAAVCGTPRISPEACGSPRTSPSGGCSPRISDAFLAWRRGVDGRDRVMGLDAEERAVGANFRRPWLCSGGSGEPWPSVFFICIAVGVH